MVGDRHQGHPTVGRIHPAVQVARGFELGSTTGDGRLADLFQSGQLTQPQISALTTVERHGELRLGELARLEQIGKSTMTRLVSKLEDAGYLHRWVDRSDGRVSLVTVTDHGADVLRAARARQQAYLLRQFEALDVADQAALLASVAALEKLLAVKA